MTDVVLGGEGLVGRALCQELTSAGHNVISLDLKNGFDLRHAELEWLGDGDRIWFLAWDTGGAKYLSDSEKQHSMYLHNTELCARIFPLIEQSKKPFLFVTSQLAGQQNAYGITKLLGESWARQLGGKIARLWNVYGWEEPGERSHVIPDLVVGGLRGSVTCGTDGRERRQFIHCSDGARALVHLFAAPQMQADISSGDWVPIADVAYAVAELTGSSVSFGAKKGTESALAPTIPLIGWTPQASLTEGLLDVIDGARTWSHSVLEDPHLLSGGPF